MGDESEEDVRTGFKPVLDMMVDAAVEMCSDVSESFGQQVQKGKEPWDKDVFLLNCLTHLVVSSRLIVGRLPAKIFVVGRRTLFGHIHSQNTRSRNCRPILMLELIY